MFWIVKDLRIGDAGDAIYVVDALPVEEWRERVQEAMRGEYGRDWEMRLSPHGRDVLSMNGIVVPMPEEVFAKQPQFLPIEVKPSDTIAVVPSRAADPFKVVKVLPRDFLADILDEATFDTSVKVLFGVSPDDALAPFEEAKDVVPSLEVGVHVRGKAFTIERAGDEGACSVCGRRTHWWFDNLPVCSFKCLKTAVFGGENGSRN